MLSRSDWLKRVEVRLHEPFSAEVPRELRRLNAAKRAGQNMVRVSTRHAGAGPACRRADGKL